MIQAKTCSMKSAWCDMNTNRMLLLSLQLMFSKLGCAICIPQHNIDDRGVTFPNHILQESTLITSLVDSMKHEEAMSELNSHLFYKTEFSSQAREDSKYIQFASKVCMCDFYVSFPVLPISINPAIPLHLRPLIL